MKNLCKIFFGAGRIGKRIYEVWNFFGLRPDFFMDNDLKLWGKYLCDIEILPPKKLLEMKYIKLYITCRKSDEIYRQVCDEYGIENIEICNNYYEEFSKLCTKKSKRFLCNENKEELIEENRVFWDLENGLVMGGVESWSIDMAKKIKTRGWKSTFLVTAEKEEILSIDMDVLKIPYSNGNLKNAINYCVSEILKYKHVNIICNFAGFNIICACLAKKIAPERIAIIAVVHSDDNAYYESYMKLSSYIDFCLVISSRIGEKVITKGFSREKVKLLNWEVFCPDINTKRYSFSREPLKIGYAGRLEIEAKRIDLLIELAKKMNRLGIDFFLEIAGIGVYENQIKEQIQRENLSAKIKMLGYVSKKDISEFWMRQDIMLSCSDYEGHSISQVEAMAAGVVPIVTDVSGARDDINDGVNGFIVPVGNIDAMITKITYLNTNKELLKYMGNEANKTIVERQKNLNQIDFFESLLKRQIK